MHQERYPPPPARRKILSWLRLTGKQYLQRGTGAMHPINKPNTMPCRNGMEPVAVSQDRTRRNWYMHPSNLTNRLVLEVGRLMRQQLILWIIFSHWPHSHLLEYYIRICLVHPLLSEKWGGGDFLFAENLNQVIIWQNHTVRYSPYSEY